MLVRKHLTIFGTKFFFFASAQPITFDGWELTEKFESVERIIPIEQEPESKIFLLALFSPKGIYLKNYIPHLKKIKDYGNYFYILN